MSRNVKRVVKGKKTFDGAGVSLTRVIGYHDVEDFDPFLMLDGFDTDDPKDYIKGFPWHPHRGIETVTYLIDGIIEHGDSLKNSGVITGGSCQWMTAGSGIIHQEMPKPDAKNQNKMKGVQLWINLRKKDKMTIPAYRDITSDDIVLVEEENSTVRVISGEYLSAKGFFNGDYVKTLLLDVEIKKNSTWEIKIDKNDTVFFYIIDGACSVDKSEELDKKSAVLLDNSSDHIIIKTKEENARILLFSGKAIKEPVAWGGPIVMNTSEELDVAFEELKAGVFIKHK